MPELPEVETIVTQLRKVIKGLNLSQIILFDDKLKNCGLEKIADFSLIEVSRHGKEIVFNLLTQKDQDANLREENPNLLNKVSPAYNPQKFLLLIHLRMTGQLIWESNNQIDTPGEEPVLEVPYVHQYPKAEKHLRAKFIFTRTKDKNSPVGELLFYDIRRFGTIRYFELIPPQKMVEKPGAFDLTMDRDSTNVLSIMKNDLTIKGVADRHSLESGLYRLQAVDPLSPEFTEIKLRELIFSNLKFTKQLKLPTRSVESRGQAIKQWLLRQDRVVGIGNIYASEILYFAKIHPERKTFSLQDSEIKRLHQAIIEVLRQAIKHSGTSFSDYRQANGDTGEFQNFLEVYGRENLPCRQCQQVIVRVIQNGRSTFFCPDCQS